MKLSGAGSGGSGASLRGAVVTGIEAHSKKPHMYRISILFDPITTVEQEWSQQPEPQTEGGRHGRADRERRKRNVDQAPAERETEPEGLEAEYPEASSASEKGNDWNAEVDAMIAEAKSVKRSSRLTAKGTKAGSKEFGAKSVTRDSSDGEFEEANRLPADDEAILTVHEDTLVSWRLLKGRRLSAEEVGTLQEEERKEEAYRAALAMLERKARTTVELSKALKRKGFGAEAIAACAERLRSRGMLNDAAFAKRFAEQRVSGHKKGRMLIRQELLQRGVERKDAEKAIEGLDVDTEKESALALARKKWPGTKGTDRERQMKLMGMLLRRGFPSGVARNAVREAASDLGRRDEDETNDQEYDQEYDPEYAEASFYDPRDIDD